MKQERSLVPILGVFCLSCNEILKITYFTEFFLLTTILLLRTTATTTTTSYNADQAQCCIHSRSWVCSRLDYCRGRGRGTCFARKCTSLSVFRDIRKRNRCHALFWVIIKPWANLWVWAGPTLHEIWTVITFFTIF